MTVVEKGFVVDEIKSKSIKGTDAGESIAYCVRVIAVEYEVEAEVGCSELTGYSIREAMETSEVELYSSFADVIGIIFNNWTAIKLAVEHGMGGPPAVTQLKLTSMIDLVAQTMSSGNVDWYEISDLLADAVDAEFSTILEDNSNDEVANHLCQLYRMFCEGDHASLQAALASLPIRTPINRTVLHTMAAQVQQTDSSEDEEEEGGPPEDDGWTVVKRR